MDGTKAATGIKGWLVNKGIAAKLANYRAGDGLTHAIYDRLIFNKMK
jgi:long-chain acyl-CoA synthetase